MRIVIIGENNSDLAKAGLEAADSGADIRCFSNLSLALDDIHGGRSAELLLVDAESDVGDVIAELTAARIHLPVVAYGKNCSASIAATAIRAGAKDFIALPPDSELIAAILRSIADNGDPDPIFHDRAMSDVMQLAKQFAPTDATVLITGESGTGKEVMARYLWNHSRRADRVFVSVNCAAIPENLLESELFGHEKGAFTGALQRRVGKFEEADGGTLLLDEISEMDIRLQAKLLRAIQEREIDRVGGSRPVRVDIRLLATSNRDLRVAVANGEFREDLLFRLNVLQLELPPLRKRVGDIAHLASLFIDKYAELNRLPPRRLASTALKVLKGHVWPGNVRELENCMHRAVLLAGDGRIGPEHLGIPSVPSTPSATDTAGLNDLIGRTVAEVERDLILGTLAKTSGNRTRAAEILGISIRTLRNKLQQYRPESAGVG